MATRIAITSHELFDIVNLLEDKGIITHEHAYAFDMPIPPGYIAFENTEENYQKVKTLLHNHLGDPEYPYQGYTLSILDW